MSEDPSPERIAEPLVEDLPEAPTAPGEGDVPLPHAVRPTQARERAATPGPSEGNWGPTRRRLSAGLVISVTLVAFEALAVGTVMPVVVRDLSGLALYGWAFSAFFLGNLVGIVFAGLQIDRHGPARPFGIGVALFAIGLVIGGFAPAMPVLVLGRAIQGFGGAAIPTVAFVSIGRSYPESHRPQMFATMSTAWVVPGLIGPGVAGLVADHLTWRLVLLGLVPFVLAGGALVLPALRPMASLIDEADAPAMRDRLVASLGVAVGAGLLLAASTIGIPVAALVLAVAGIALGVPPLRRLLPRGTLRATRGLPSTILIRGISTFAFFGAQAYLPLALVTVRGASVSEAGLALTFATISWTAGSWTQARLMPSWRAPRLIRTGFAFVTVALAVVATVLSPAVPIPVAVVAWAVGGYGMGLLYSSIAQLVLLDAPLAEHGTASASMQLSDVLGSALGTGFGGALVAAGSGAGLAPAVGLGAAFGVVIAAAASGVVVSGRLKPSPA